MVLDITVMLVVLLLMVLGLIRGFVKEVFGIAGMVAVVCITAEYSDYFSDMYSARVHSEALANVFSGVTVFVCAMTCAILANSVIVRVLSPLRHSLLDKTAGSIVGVAKGLVASYFLFFVMETFLYVFAPPSVDEEAGSQIELPGWFVDTYSYNVFSVASEYIGSSISDQTYEKITVIARELLEKKRASRLATSIGYADGV
ncbi:CvpA family protein [Candidatus Anaplasma sp. TIGMIC]|uniref:CvpA family protein n=1 Tax=Candidatus Anaplasma sp. TIGMIC TaxID=3020713 RepID=UPI00232B9E70|nr:CvpA family protein [Candidatus Anaplasma sp. TIGMIC]MDB1135133.1 CvpA family protein [Candidatus Anaplasma sp. TIGMIC]